MDRMGSQVFISHASADRASANRIRGALESDGIRCWIAPRDIVPGKDWGEAIVEALAECRVMVLVLSAAANESREVRREVQCAFAKDVAVVPLRIEHVSPAKGLQYYLNSVHWLDVYPPKEQNLGELVETVRRHLRGEWQQPDDGAGGNHAVRSPTAANSVTVAPASAAPISGPAPEPGPLAYATPFPARRGRWTAWVVAATLGVVVIAVLAGFTYFRSLMARDAARRAAALAALATAARTWVPPAPTAIPRAAASPAAQGTIAARDVLDDLTVLDNHLSLLNRILEAGPTEKEVNALRDLEESTGTFASYVNTFGTTRGSFGSGAAPVKDRVEALGALGAKPQSVRTFADSLFDFARAERDLPPRLDELIRRGKWVELAEKLGFGESAEDANASARNPLDQEPTSEAEQHDAFARRALAAESAELRALAEVAHASGLRVLGEIGTNLPPGADGRLAVLKSLEPKELLTGTPLDALEGRDAAQSVRAAADRRAVEAEGELLWRRTTEAWSARLMPPFRLSGRPFEQVLALVPADTPDRYHIAPDGPSLVAVNQATSARQDGWEGAAAAAFFCYAVRFGSTDPAAEDYARAAVQYILQRQRLGMPERRGVLYAANVPPPAGAGAGADDRLRAGDLLIAYGSKSVSDVEELAAAVKETPAGQPVQIEFLRRDDHGLFTRHTATLPQGGAVPAVLLPI